MRDVWDNNLFSCVIFLTGVQCISLKNDMDFFFSDLTFKEAAKKAGRMVMSGSTD